MAASKGNVFFLKDIFFPEAPFEKALVRLNVKNPIINTMIIRRIFNNINTKLDSTIIAKIEIYGISAQFRTEGNNAVSLRKRIEIKRDKQAFLHGVLDFA